MYYLHLCFSVLYCRWGRHLQYLHFADKEDPKALSQPDKLDVILLEDSVGYEPFPSARNSCFSHCHASAPLNKFNTQFEWLMLWIQPTACFCFC